MSKIVIIDEYSDVTSEQIKHLLNKTLKDNPKLQQTVFDFRGTEHGDDFDNFELFEEVKND